ncbi:hypothetical protein ACLB9X_15545 [Streptomyces sp. 5K101]
MSVDLDDDGGDHWEVELGDDETQVTVDAGTPRTSLERDGADD